MVHIYNGILLSHKKERIWVSPNEVDEPRAYDTEWSKSEKNKYCTLHAYVWNLERWYWWIYFQGSNREADTENRRKDTRRGKEKLRYMESAPWKLTLPYVKQTANKNLLHVSGNSNRCSYQPTGMGWGGGDVRKVQERGHIYAYGWFMLMFHRKQQNSVNQWSFN